MMLKIPRHDGFEIRYQNDKHLEQLRENAVGMHKELIHDHLLEFPMHFAVFEIDDLAHDTQWLDKSAEIFCKLFLLENAEQRERSGDLHLFHAQQLMFAIKMALLAVLPCVQKKYKYKSKRAYDVPAMKNAVEQVIHEYFDEDRGRAWGMFAYYP